MQRSHLSDITTRRFGQPDGRVYIDIWNDNGLGTPDVSVGRVGSIDTPSVSVAGDNYHFESPVLGLTPNDNYYLVLSMDGTNWSGADRVDWGGTRSNRGTNGAHEGLATISPMQWHTIGNLPDPKFPGPPVSIWHPASVEAVSESPLLAGDADQNFDFDQLDLVQVQVAAKYLTGQPATWGEGDWDGAPGGEVGAPPTGDRRFDQFDIIAALNANIYLMGPYAALALEGMPKDEQTSIVYDPETGEVAVDAPASTKPTSINLESATGIFTGDAPMHLGGCFDNNVDNKIFKATIGNRFDSLSFGNVADTGLSRATVVNDLAVIGSLAEGDDLGQVDAIYVPEPANILLLSIGLIIGLFHFSMVKR